jgi:6-phosphogluconolactonase (cycloisomerase 2 family)
MMGCLAALPAVEARGELLQPVGTVVDAVGLDGALFVTVSPDGAHVYASSESDSSVSVFSRIASTGALTLVEVQTDGIAGINFLHFVIGLALSPDGAHLYAAARSDSAVTVFSRDATTGKLTFVEAQRDGVGGVDGLQGARGVAVSADGNHVYVASEGDDAVAVFSRNGTTGELTFVETEKDGMNGVDGLNAARFVALSSDGASVYATGNLDDAIAVFSRDASTGAITFVEVEKDGVSTVDGLADAEWISVSPDDAHVYVTGVGDNAVAVFSRDATTGALTFVEVLVDGAGGVDGLRSAWAVAVSSSGAHVYVSAGVDDSVALFTRDATTGMLTFVELRRDGQSGVDGLDGAAGIALSPGDPHLYAASFHDNAIAAFSRNGTTGSLTFVEAERETSGLVKSLDGTTDVIVSPDGLNVYATADEDHSLTAFGRNPATGLLTFLEHEQDGVAGVDGLRVAEALAISPDGAHVYVAGRSDNAVAVFSRNGATGMLTFVEIEQQSAGGVTGLNAPFGVAVSPDGAHVYAASFLSNAVVAFGRDAATGALTFIEAEVDGQSGVDGLNRARDVAVSPDGAHVYVVAGTDDAVAVFTRNASTGELTFVEFEKDGQDGVDGLNGANGIAISADGKHVYTSGEDDDAVAVFTRDPMTGSLAFVEVHKDEAAGITTLNFVQSVTVSPDGMHVYAAADFDRAVTAFRRDPVTGMLTFVEAEKDGVGGVEFLDGASGVHVSPDSGHVYASADDGDAIEIFELTTRLSGSVNLEGRPAPPDSSWSVPLTVTLQGGAPAVAGPVSQIFCHPTTDTDGDFGCAGFPAGNYAVCAKHSHTLQQCLNVTLVEGSNDVDFGTLAEGDADNNNCVALVDFSILATSFGTCESDPGFDSRADFDLNGCVVLVDFSRLASNFSQCGDEPSVASTPTPAVPD